MPQTVKTMMEMVSKVGQNNSQQSHNNSFANSFLTLRKVFNVCATQLERIYIARNFLKVKVEVYSVKE